MSDRELKFRAWDGEDMIFFDFRLCNDESSAWYQHTIEKGHVMQFTGLHDRNGVEIYEGDILEMPVTNSWQVVIFDQGEFSTRFAKVASGGQKHDFGTAINRITVIGNIHANPELMEVA